MKTRKPKYKTIVLRGCLIRVNIAKADDLERAEKALSAEDWKKNRVD